MLFIEYPKCSTCKRAKSFLDNCNVNYIDRNIVVDNPSYEELKSWVVKYNLDIKKLFNTSGIKYRELNLKEKLLSMSEDDKLKLLATDGMLVKRPILVDNDKLLIGFKEEEWNNIKWKI